MKKHATKLVSTLTLAAVCALTSACQKGEDSGDFTVSLNADDVPLIDAPATSCKSRVSGSSATDDIAPFHMNVGQMTIKWKPPEAGTTLKIVYIRITLRSSGIKEDVPPIQVSSQDLQCAMRGSIDGGEEIIVPGATDVVLDPATNIYTFRFKKDLIMGGITGKDGTKRTSFNGNADVLVYATEIKEGSKTIPVTGRTTFRFNFMGIY